MLVLSRGQNEDVIIDLPALLPLIDTDPDKLRKILSEPAVVRVAEIRDGRRARLGFDLDTSIPIHRSEVYAEIQREIADHKRRSEERKRSFGSTTDSTTDTTTTPADTKQS